MCAAPDPALITEGRRAARIPHLASRERASTSSSQQTFSRIGSDVPQHIMGDAFVVVPDNVADAGNLRPWDFRMASLELVAEVAARFGDDLNAAFDEPTFALVRRERAQTNSRHLAVDQLNGLDDVGQPRDRSVLLH
jgi:hypothetical protein